MSPAFKKDEYHRRIELVRASMRKRGLEVLLVGDPSNINWLTGYDAWSFYTPQMLLLDLHGGPFWIGREMDSGAASFTTFLTPLQVVSYPEALVQRDDKHPSDFVAEWMEKSGYGAAVIGYESDAYYTSPRSIAILKFHLQNAKWVEADLLVNWERLVKSEVELKVMQQAATIADLAMQTAWEKIQPGVRQCDLMADIISAQIKGTSEFGGDITALHPLILVGKMASTAHPLWTDAKLEKDQIVAFELGGCRNRYNVGLARTVQIGSKKPKEFVDTVKAVEEGMEAVLGTLRANVPASEVHKQWQLVLNRYGMEKKSRIGYSIGVGYPPDWGERTVSFREKERVKVPQNAVVHIILGMWMTGWGMELSETIHVREHDCVALSKLSRDVRVI
ncbi:MAG: M24 family metallopeptidase [Pseudomonadota bacterium]|nr:M24 family metallopeptidase [Pseudomonadota bacterium]